MLIKGSQTGETSQGAAKEEKDIKREISPVKPESFPIVGIGASAGGLEALIEFFSALPEKTGMAFIVVQHSSPDYPSLLPSILQQHTPMPVMQAQDGLKVKPDQVYVIPSEKNMQMVDQTLRLFAKPERPYVPHSIDLFFRSLADDLKDKAIGVILSGMGSDGTFGSRLINRKLGMVIAQDPATALFPDMPKSIIETGVADYIAPPSVIPQRLMEWVKDYYGKTPQEREAALKKNPDELKEIFQLYKAHTQTDLSQFKLSTIYRRIQRRMAIRQIDSIPGYIRLLEHDPNEISILFKEFIINVTAFFQDPPAFANLKKFFLEFLQNKPEVNFVRGWTIGCSTGEETYSFAILIQECLDELKLEAQPRIFATDMDESAINLARTGLYPSSIVAEDVTAERIDKYFDKKGDYYQVKKELRQNVVFSKMEFISKPSFINLDLISSRSILVYLNAEAHRKLIPIMHYTLNPQGLVFLGARDSMEQFKQLFHPLDQEHKIYERVK